jgi:polysaccharide deacetylase family protein (PEP-CTERM system associated)
MKNAITIDLEDYYQVSAFANDVGVDQWDSFASRIEMNAARLLSILDELGVKATFFTLGWVARKYPKLVREIADRRHEIACHSNVHRSVNAMTSDEFRDDTLQSKRLLEDVAGERVYGYRAPSFSITRNSLWAFEILAELGFSYDSSIFPIKHPNYGWPRAPRFPFTIKTASGSIMEFPMPTLEMAGLRAPLGGGAYLRLLPYWYTRWGLRHINNSEDRPACIYVHPWELDSEQPRMTGSISAQLRHYFGLRRAELKFRRLLRDFEFQPLVALIGELKSDCSLASRERLPEVHLADLGRFLGEELQRSNIVKGMAKPSEPL